MRVGEDGLAAPVRLYDGATPPGSGELLVRYRYRSRQVNLGAASFFFQEGKAKKFQPARYGILKVDPAGNSILVGLADKDKKVIGTTADIKL
jgi:uncharacterized membrane-anchored protein